MSGSIQKVPSLGMLERQPRLSDKVAEQILETILSHRLRPGDQLPPERELGEQFGVSRTVVREAVRALDARGLLEVRVGSRIKVAAVDPRVVTEAIEHFVRSHDVDEQAITEIAAALDVAVAGLAAERATDADRDRIADALAQVEGAGAGAESAFHRAVVAASHDELVTVLADAMAHLRASYRIRAHESGGPVCRAVAAAIGRGDVKDARRAMLERLG